jgi:hypothetical protein
MGIKKKYFLFAIILFFIEVFIALFVHDAVIRPYVGDYLVVFLIYCVLMTFINARPWYVATAVLLFSFAIELLQYVHIVERLGLGKNSFARTMIGIGFDWLDILAYIAGFVSILLFEKWNSRHY